jgi:hypothetical protein
MPAQLVERDVTPDTFSTGPRSRTVAVPRPRDFDRLAPALHHAFDGEQTGSEDIQRLLRQLNEIARYCTQN